MSPLLKVCLQAHGGLDRYVKRRRAAKGWTGVRCRAFPGRSPVASGFLFCLILQLSVCLASWAQPIVDKAAPVYALDGSSFREWLVLGPFQSREIETDFLAEAGGEAHVRPQQGDKVRMADGKELVWKRLRSKQDLVDLEQVYNGLEWSIFYAYCEVNAEKAAETDARMASWLPGTLFWNQQRVGRFPVRDHFDLAPTLPIRLSQGRNRCLLKLQFEFEPPHVFMFQLLPSNRGTAVFHVSDTTGQPVAGARLHLYAKGELSARLATDASGNAEACLFPLADSYEVQVTSNDLGSWLPAITVVPGERQRFDVVLRKAVSISGQTHAMDGSPQTSIVVQALHIADGSGFDRTERSSTSHPTGSVSEPQVNRGLTSGYARRESDSPSPPIRSLIPTPEFSKSVVSDTNGNFRFVNLRPGQYRLRAHGAHDFVVPDGEVDAANPARIHVGPGRTNGEVRFVFPEARKGTSSRFQVKNGLTEVSPLIVHRTADGMLWIGTSQNSLHTFDGLSVKELSTAKVPMGYVHSLAQDPSGALWIGSEKGISRAVDGNVSHLTINDELPGMNVGKVIADPDGTVWFGTTMGLIRHDKQGFQRWTIKDGLPSNPVGALLRARDGSLWMSTLHSLARFDGRTFSEPVLLSGTRRMTGDRLYQSKDGAIWFSSRAFENAIYRYDGTNMFRLGEEEGLGFRMANDIAETSDGTIWIATDQGLASYNGKRIHIHPGLGEVVRIFVDRDDVIWCSTLTDVFRLDPKSFVGIAQRDGLMSKQGGVGVFTIHPDVKGSYLVGTEWGGVFRLGGEARDRVTQLDYLREQYVRQIVRSGDGSLWFGTSTGIYRQTETRVERVVDRSWIVGMDFDDRGLLWFGDGWIGGGVTSFNPSTRELTTLTRKEGLPDNSVWAITRAPGGGVFIGTGAGLAELKDGKLQNVGERMGERFGAVMSLGRDEDGSIWIGGDTGGRSLSGTNLVALNPTDKLPIGGVWCRTRTADGITWIGTDRNGLLGYDGIARTQLDRRDGLLGDRVICLRRDEDETLLIGFTGVNGITRYRRTKSLPTVSLVEVRVESRSFSEFANLPSTEIGKPVNVQYQEIDLKTHPEKRQFFYRVQGPKGETLYSGVTKERWFEWTPRRGGAYTFEVKAIDRDLNYSRPARLTLLATVPWYANAWITVPGAVGICVLLLFSVVTGWRVLVHRREVGRLKERARFARDLHDHLGAGLTHLAMVGEQVRQKADKTGEVQLLATRLSESARALTRTMGEVIWATDPDKDTLKSLALFVGRYAERFFAESSIRLRFDIQEDLPESVLSSEVRNSLFMVVKEALNNVAKHAQASELRIKLDLCGRELSLTIEDDGLGFARNQASADCHGLINMENRLRELGGELRIESVLGRGTRVIARLSLAK